MSNVNSESRPWADPATGQCPVAETLRTLGGKHGPHVLHCLAGGELYFLELVRALDGISHKVLTDQLKDFEKSGLVARSLKNDSRRRVGYSLTAKGKALGSILVQLNGWHQAYR